MGGYEALARVYDKLNRDVDHGFFADFYENAFARFGKKKIHSVLDLGCGTGSLTLELARRGYDMTGLDNCSDMLAQASDRGREEGLSDILWLMADMTDFELYGTVDAVTCCLDGINHLYRPGDAEKCFRLVHLFLEPDGLFLFDLNTPYKFKEIYAEHDYVLEDEGAVCCWRNEWHPTSKTCDFYLTVFEEMEDGSYLRSNGVQKERCFTEKQMRRMLEKASFEVLGFFASPALDAPDGQTERWFVAARALKE